MNVPVTTSMQGPMTDDLRSLIDRSLVAHVATLDRAGRPVTWPMTPYLDASGAALEVSTGVTYPAKAERVRRNPHVCVLLGGGHEPLARITALATVLDRDLQANTDRFIREAMTKTGAGWSHLPRALVRAQAWHWVRIYIMLTPVAVDWWPDGHMDGPAQTWTAPRHTTAPQSDPAPTGPTAGAWQRPPGPWPARADYAAARLGNPTLTVARADGYPLIVTTSVVGIDGGGIRLNLPEGAAIEAGPACLTFERVHGDGEFLGQENAVFTGSYSPGNTRFDIDRLLPDFSLPAHGIAKHWAFLSARRRLTRRLEAECARRGQPVPHIHVP